MIVVKSEEIVVKAERRLIEKMDCSKTPGDCSKLGRDCRKTSGDCSNLEQHCRKTAPDNKKTNKELVFS
ncbi:hypothetical protein [Psychrobacillus sp. FSL K6-1267]|uniref:hypothetical protein n=1 Tax=Psychrobacillus sp. FSL K6-1267 TaxID=2921543 RepID=UPI0030FCEDC4